MKIISLNVGLPEIVINNGEPVSTGIFKEPSAERRMLRTLNLDGDRQADLSVHGGPNKAVYGYPSEHYEFWRNEFPEMELPWGMFGENFTTEGLFEDKLNIGDKFQIGDAIIRVAQPRMPCFKLAIKFERSDILRRFLQSGRSGFYFSVLQEGEVGPGDDFQLLETDNNNVRVSDITRLYVSDKGNTELLNRALKVEALPESWKNYFRERLEKR
jgi:MOSC domain-containing protein YiiM